MSLGNNILRERKELKLSQEQLAEKVGVARQTISNWELDETKPTSDQLKLLSKTLNISIDKLLDNDIDLIIQKVNNTEKLIKKQVNFSKIILITLYFLILSSLVFYTVYKFTKKDYTDPYQSSFVCADSYGDITISITEEESTYIIDADGDRYYAGDSLSEAFASLKIIKQLFIKDGYICK